MALFDDGETLEPAKPIAGRESAPSLRLVFDGGTSRPAATLHWLTRGTTALGRSVTGARDVHVDDPRASRVHAEIIVDKDGARLLNRSKYGTRVNALPVEESALRDRDVIGIGDSCFVYRTQTSLETHVEGGVSHTYQGVSAEAASVRADIAIAARGAASILVLGPTGSGKEVVARAIHAAMGRRGALVAVNTSAIPESLAESQLFGHRAGAFTGAKSDHAGFFVEAQQGTLLLDEIGDLPLALQPKLLRVLEERTVRPLGAQRSEAVDVVVIGATHQDLERAVEGGTFRADLYARLAELVIRVPPLAHRREDILAFAVARLDEGMQLGPALAERLLVYPWPFHVRELLKVMAEARARAEGRSILDLELVEQRLPLVESSRGSNANAAATVDDAAATTAGAMPIPDRAMLETLLARHGGVVADVAREAGRSRKQVYRWIAEHGLDAAQFRRE